MTSLVEELLEGENCFRFLICIMQPNLLHLCVKTNLEKPQIYRILPLMLCKFDIFLRKD